MFYKFKTIKYIIMSEGRGTRSHVSHKSKSKSYRSMSKSSVMDTELVQATTRMAEMLCRAEALKKRAAIEKAEYHLKECAMDLEQEKKLLEVETEIEVEEAKIAALERIDRESKTDDSSCQSLLDQLP